MMTKTDRRVQRTREALQQALVALLREKRYAAITVGDIAERANLGRTTFYLHYHDKDALFVSCHESIVGQFHFGPHHSLSREELLSPNARPATAAAYRHLAEIQALMQRLFQGKESLLLLRRIRGARARDIEANLRAAFTEADSALPFDLLASYLAGAQLAQIHWWLEQRQPCTPEALAQALHRLQRAAIRDAFKMRDND